MTVKLMMIDMDGTLFNDSKAYDRERFDRVVETLTDQGVIVAIATGNTEELVQREVNPESLLRLHRVTINGNFIMHGDQVLESLFIEKSVIAPLQKILHEFECEASIMLASGERQYVLMEKGQDQNEISFYYPDAVKISAADEMAEADLIHMCDMYLHNKNASEIKELALVIMDRHPELGATFAGDRWLSVFDKQGGKGSAARFLQARYGIEVIESMAFGDSMNDFSMMEAVGYSMAMGNADLDLVAACNYQIGRNNDAAVLQVMEMVARGDYEAIEEFKR